MSEENRGRGQKGGREPDHLGFWLLFQAKSKAFGGLEGSVQRTDSCFKMITLTPVFKILLEIRVQAERPVRKLLY